MAFSSGREDLAQMPFSTMCIKESLRLHPSVTAISRRCTQDVPLGTGQVVPKGMVVALVGASLCPPYP